MKKYKLLIFLGLFGCIQTDLEDPFTPTIRIDNSVSDINFRISGSYVLKAVYTDDSGEEVNTDYTWSSSNTEVISVDECKKFKPHRDVYNLVIDKFNINEKNCIFFSSNCWDIHGASNFGFQTVWVNRKKNIDELLPGKVDDQVRSLKEYFF